MPARDRLNDRPLHAGQGEGAAQPDHRHDELIATELVLTQEAHQHHGDDHRERLAQQAQARPIHIEERGWGRVRAASSPY